MFTNLFLAVALFATAAPNQPIPVKENPSAKDGKATITSPPPRLLELKPEADGKVKIAVNRPKKAQPGFGGLGAPGVKPIQGGGGFMFQNLEKVNLADVKDLTITTTSGKEITKEEGLKSLAKGGFVVVSADGKKISPDFLKMFKDDVLVLTSPELVTGFGNAILFGK
ncbi:MAG: hypothetical protein K8T89_14795 [Planctomycetes bacterium]|nr:hypothetical protein [Planctomycetota bacterium]